MIVYDEANFIGSIFNTCSFSLAGTLSNKPVWHILNICSVAVSLDAWACW